MREVEVLSIGPMVHSLFPGPAAAGPFGGLSVRVAARGGGGDGLCDNSAQERWRLGLGEEEETSTDRKGTFQDGQRRLKVWSAGVGWGGVGSGLDGELLISGCSNVSGTMSTHPGNS